MSGKLYVVATPIGNLEDITLRAVRILKEVDFIACEDTRVSAKLLARLEVSKPLVSMHEHSVGGTLTRMMVRLQSGENAAYICDAGTPGMNDPGGKLVAACFEVGIKVEPIPGPSALTAAISACGFPMDDFNYVGFAPHKKGRQTFFREIAGREIPTIFLESTHRIMKTVDELTRVLPKTRPVFIGRELTKLHETLYRGPIDQIREQLQATSTKGEFIIILGPSTS